MEINTNFDLQSPSASQPFQASLAGKKSTSSRSGEANTIATSPNPSPERNQASHRVQLRTRTNQIKAIEIILGNHFNRLGESNSLEHKSLLECLKAAHKNFKAIADFGSADKLVEEAVKAASINQTKLFD